MEANSCKNKIISGGRVYEIDEEKKVPATVA